MHQTNQPLSRELLIKLMMEIRMNDAIEKAREACVRRRSRGEAFLQDRYANRFRVHPRD